MERYKRIRVYTRTGDKGRLRAAAGSMSLSDYLLVCVNAEHNLNLTIHGGVSSETAKDNGHLTMYLTPGEYSALLAAAGERRLSPWIKETANKHAGKTIFEGCP